MKNDSHIEHFILVYDHSEDRLIDEMPYGRDGERAAQAYLDLEKTYRGRKDIEIVLVGSDSIETIKKTHSNYFGYEVITDPLLKELLDSLQ